MIISGEHYGKAALIIFCGCILYFQLLVPFPNSFHTLIINYLLTTELKVSFPKW